MNFVQKIIKKNNSLSRLEIELIISHLIKKPREWVIAHFDEIKLDKKQQKRFAEKVAQLKKGKPLAQILKEKYFFGNKFFIDKNVLIPRPETELLVEKALKKIQKNLKKGFSKKILIADVGTGSGVIIISIAKNLSLSERKNCLFFGIDISSLALQVSKKNASRIQENCKIYFLKGNLIDPFEKKLKNFLEKSETQKKIPSEIFFLANLPYLSEKEFLSAHKNVRLFEPKEALFSPQNGLYHYKNLFKKVRKITQKYPSVPIHLFIEFSPSQKKELSDLIEKFFSSTNKTKFLFYKDLAGKWRLMEIEINPSKK